ncbi:hypothetical protein E3O19_02275 [Cryobacterium algoritolerans]|uniref:Uncharacterized protein n=1 Tax=Cryobacterium algoritolerans TaxID=1259184 RepID=A0A4R8X1K2_9MICO|nr:hypothetical protein E3O19_02275 [Cryobacterium algoritolerans]
MPGSVSAGGASVPGSVSAGGASVPGSVSAGGASVPGPGSGDQHGALGEAHALVAHRTEK